ncbi:MAG TPA: agmatinase [Thermoanaerobaculia bacterium]|jgi:agmatinase|nr:agmatinase [Thermoanaerobaculia bacterium]
MTEVPENFLGLPAEASRYETSRVVVLPVPFERTTSYGKGTALGPAAILAASRQVELWEEMLRSEPWRMGIATLPPFEPAAQDAEAALAELEAEARRHLEAGKFLVTLGGEHSLTIGPVRAARAVHGEIGQSDIGVVQFDAHADLRPEYDGTPWSHASVMRRLHEDGIPALAVGIRALCDEEAALIADKGLPTIWGWELPARERFLAEIERLPEKVYLTFDVDFFDPSLMPATGTPVPGGGAWYPTLDCLRELFARKTVVAMDVVELAPLAGAHGADFLAASLVHKCLAYLQAAGG